MKLDKRFLDRSIARVKEAESSYSTLLYFVEDFKSRFGDFPEAKEPLEQAEQAFAAFRAKAQEVSLPLKVEQARSRRTPSLEYGLDYLLTSAKAKV